MNLIGHFLWLVHRDSIKNITADPNQMWAMWKFFLDVLNEHAPLTKIKVKGNNLPYIDSETRRLIRQRDYRYHREKIKENKGTLENMENF